MCCTLNSNKNDATYFLSKDDKQNKLDIIGVDPTVPAVPAASLFDEWLAKSATQQ